MTLKIIVSDELRRPESRGSFVFPDHMTSVRFGRRPGNDVELPASDTRFGRDHFELQRVSGNLRVVVDHLHPLYFCGRRMEDGDFLPTSARLNLATSDGPWIKVEVMDDHTLPLTHLLRPLTPRTKKLAYVASTSALLGLVAISAVLINFWIDQRRHTALAEETRTLANKVEEVKIGQEAEKGKWGDLLKDLKESVYVVVVQVGGKEQPVGTAWVLHPGVLVTNAHVAERAKPQPGVRTVVRSALRDNADIPVVSVLPHPAYGAFRDAVADASGGQEFGVVGSYDVALLIVSDADRLAKPIKLASPASAEALRAGTEVASIGYPIELETFGLARARFPAPRLQQGIVTGLTDFFGVATPSNADAEVGLLVHHNLPAHGGASGSPIVNDKGEVVAIFSGGDTVTMCPPATVEPAMKGAGQSEQDHESLSGEGLEEPCVRIGTGAESFYAQRADLLNDFDSPWTSERWNQEKKSWEAGALFQAKYTEIKQRVTDVTGDAGVDLGITTRVDEAGTLRARHAYNDSADIGDAVIDADFTEPGAYLAIAYAVDNPDIPLGLRAAVGRSFISSPFRISGRPFIPLKVDGKQRASFIVRGAISTNFRLRIYRLEEQ